MVEPLRKRMSPSEWNALTDEQRSRTCRRCSTEYLGSVMVDQEIHWCQECKNAWQANQRLYHHRYYVKNKAEISAYHKKIRERNRVEMGSEVPTPFDEEVTRDLQKYQEESEAAKKARLDAAWERAKEIDRYRRV